MTWSGWIQQAVVLFKWSQRWIKVRVWNLIQIIPTLLTQYFHTPPHFRICENKNSQPKREHSRAESGKQIVQNKKVVRKMSKAKTDLGALIQ